MVTTAGKGVVDALFQQFGNGNDVKWAELLNIFIISCLIKNIENVLFHLNFYQMTLFSLLHKILKILVCID